MASDPAYRVNRSVCEADFSNSMTLDLIKIVDLNLGNKSVTNDIENACGRSRACIKARLLAFGSCIGTPPSG
jgi:hypothetical protein